MQKASEKVWAGDKCITAAIFISLAILLLAVLCILWIVFPSPSEGKIADIYQDGALLKSIPLDSSKEPFSFIVTGEDGRFNEIIVKEGCIGIRSASCPDKLCVHQGYIHSSLLPITCLPNRLVIQVRESKKRENHQSDSIAPDIITY